MKVKATVKLRNASMVEAREKLGWSQHCLAEQSKLSLRIIAALEQMNFTLPNIVDKVCRVAAALGITTDAVMPEEMAGQKINANLSSTREISSGLLVNNPQFVALPAPEPSNDFNFTDLHKKLNDVLGSLSSREETIIRMRFGLNQSKYVYTYREIGMRFRISPERARQIEIKALQKLQHPYRARRLTSFLGERQKEEYDKIQFAREPPVTLPEPKAEPSVKKIKYEYVPTASFGLFQLKVTKELLEAREKRLKGK